MKEHLYKRHQDLLTVNVSSASVKAAVVRRLSLSWKTPVEKPPSPLLRPQGRFVRSLLVCLVFSLAVQLRCNPKTTSKGLQSAGTFHGQYPRGPAQGMSPVAAFSVPAE